MTGSHRKYGAGRIAFYCMLDDAPRIKAAKSLLLIEIQDLSLLLRPETIIFVLD